jgi:predicted dehydrogenase
LTSGLLEFEAGTSIFTCATQLVPHQRVNIYGTRGRVEIAIPFNAPTDRPCRAWLDIDGTIEELRFETCDQYGIQADLFSRAILNDTPVPTPISDAVANMRVIDALVKSGQLNNWQSL